MIRRSGYIFVLAVLFLLAAKGLQAVGFWKFAGLAEPHGYEVQGLIFLALLFVLHNFLFAPYLDVLAERDAQTVDKKERAEKTRVDADTMIETYRQKTHEAYLEAVRNREHLALEAEEEERKRILQAKSEGNAVFSTEVERIHKEMTQARKDLEPQVAPLAKELMEQILGPRKIGGRSASMSSSMSMKKA